MGRDIDASVLRLIFAAPPLFSVLMLDEDPDTYFIDRLVELACKAAAPEERPGRDLK